MPTLPYEKAFVVQFTADTGNRLEHAAGRVEHLQTGRRSRFGSLDELRACIEALLDDRLKASDRRGPPTAGRPRTRKTPPGEPPPPPA